MKYCPVCNTPVDDYIEYCPNCGEKMNGYQVAADNYQNYNNYSQQNQDYNNYSQQNQNYNNYYSQSDVPVDPYDHTAEFDQKDISDNKVFALAIYLTGVIGLVIALFACKDSEYIRFHIRQYMKMLVAYMFLAIASIVLCWTLLAPTVATVCYIIVGVLQIIAFFQTAGGKSKEPAILRDIKCLH